MKKPEFLRDCLLLTYQGQKSLFPDSPFLDIGVTRLELDTLYQIVLEQIRTCAALALADEAKVMEELRKSCQHDSEEEHSRMKAKLAESESRLSELDALISKLYEDWVASRINETNFTRMMEKAQGEQEALQKKVDIMRERLDGVAKEQEDNSKWLSLIRQYTGTVDGELQQQSIDEVNSYVSNAVGNRKLSNSEVETAIQIAMQNVAAGADPAAELQTVQDVQDAQ